MLELHTTEGVPDGAPRAAWEKLADTDPASTIFHTPRYLQVWHEQLGGRASARLHLVSHDGEVVGAVAEAHELEGSPTGPREVRRFLGGEDVTDHLGPVSHPDERTATAIAYLGALAQDRDWDEFVASGLAEDTGWVAAFRSAAERHGLVVLEDLVEDVSPTVSLEGGYDAYLSRLPSRLRHDARRKGRKLARDAGAYALVAVDPAHHQAALDRFFDLADRGDEAERRLILTAAQQQFVRALADELGTDGSLRIDELVIGGRPVASAVSLVHGDRWAVYESTYDLELSALSPGTVLLSELIRVAGETGFASVDLLRGDRAYKYRLGAEDRRLARLSIVRGR